MRKNEIRIIYGTDYRKITQEILEASDLAGDIRQKCADHNLDLKRIRIGIKPNLVSPTEASYGATTHPEVVEGIIRYLRENGFTQIVMAEGSWVGARTGDAIDVCGYRRLSSAYGVPFIDTQKEKSFQKDCAGLTLSLVSCVRDIDYLINVPVLKGHCQTKMTCALKNMKGLLPNAEKRHFHTMGLHRPIGHLAVGIHQDFVVVDNICGDLDFEDGGNPVRADRVWTGKDPVLIDACICHLMGYEKEEVPYIGIAESLGAGCGDWKAADIRTIGFAAADLHLRGKGKIVKLADAVEEIDSCSACYGYLIPALDRLEAEGLLDDLDEKIRIGQGYRKKTGTLGIGRCTKNFMCHLDGCPPTEGEIYIFLKDYILNKRKSPADA